MNEISSGYRATNVSSMTTQPPEIGDVGWKHEEKPYRPNGLVIFSDFWLVYSFWEKIKGCRGEF